MSERTAPATPPALTPVELSRWAWRQLTSMRTALILLFLLALGAVPGSAIPQEAVDSLNTSKWQQRHPHLTPIYEKLGLFHVFGSVWFSAIYILLMISLVGCILPRTRVYWRGLRAKPPAVPRNLSRLPEHVEFHTDEAPAVVLEKARRALRGYRMVSTPLDQRSGSLDQRSGSLDQRSGALDQRSGSLDQSGGVGSISAERGYTREAGNLLFHVSVLVVLAGVAAGSLFGYKGGVIVVTGDSFANSLSQYDDFAPGGLFTPSALAPFSFKVKNFNVDFITQGRERGMAHEFSAGLSYQTSPDAPLKQTRISVNHPLKIDGTAIYLISHGYAPHVTVRDGSGHVAYAGPVVFLPEDDTFRSFGVVKVPDGVSRTGKRVQIGFEGEFYPTYAFTDASGPFSAFPDDKNPALSMLAYRGDLGLDDGVPQSLYTLDKTHLKAIRKDGKPLRVDLALGATEKLPDGLGSITFDGVSRYVKLQVSRSPGDVVALAGMSLALLGLLGSLFIRPRRIWVRVRRQEGDDDDGESGRTLVEIAGLDRSSVGDLSRHIDALAASLRPGSKETS